MGGDGEKEGEAMTHTVVFFAPDGDEVIRKIFPYEGLSIGDTVFYELTDDEIENVEKWYPHQTCEGVISEKWIDLTDMNIVWTVNMD